MARLSERVASFPKAVAAIAAAVAALSGLLLPAAIIPTNLDSLGGQGALLILIVFLVSWAFHTSLFRRRRAVMALGALVGLLALIAIVIADLSVVQRVEKIGHPPAPARYIVGKRLSAFGVSADSMLGHPSREILILQIGPDNIPETWSDYRQQALTYSVAYLVLIATIVLMISVAEFAQPRIAHPSNAKRAPKVTPQVDH